LPYTPIVTQIFKKPSMSIRSISVNVLQLALVLSLVFGAFFASTPSTVHADYPVDESLFDKTLLITDYDFTATASMTGDQVNAFLASKGSWMANYIIPATAHVPYFCNDGGVPQTQYTDVPQVHVNGTNYAGRRLADIITERAVANGINPQVMLAIAQRESSAVTSASPSSAFTLNWHNFYGFNEQLASYQLSCAAAAAIAQDYGGPALQAAYAPYGMSRLLVSRDRCPLNVTVDGQNFTARSNATAALYCYTPHVETGNHNFWRFMKAWFLPNTPTPSPIASNTTTTGYFLAA
jgi:hypothetical protein